MTRLKLSMALNYEIANQTSDFIFNIHAAQTAHQSIVAETLGITPPLTLAAYVYPEPASGTRYMRLKAKPGPLSIRYAATVDIDHHIESPACIGEIPVSLLPSRVLPYIYPSRYCQSDRLRRFATREFGHLRPGYARVQAIQEWVRLRTVFLPGSSNDSTSAIDTLIEQTGVCRDFAHLMIALCRAINIPARYVTGIDYGADAAMGPTDFHAYVEAYLGERWYLFEATGMTPPMGLIRIGTGRDAADVSFSTMFGAVRSFAPVIHIEAVDDFANGFIPPSYCAEALSSIASA